MLSIVASIEHSTAQLVKLTKNSPNCAAPMCCQLQKVTHNICIVWFMSAILSQLQVCCAQLVSCLHLEESELQAHFTFLTSLVPRPSQHFQNYTLDHSKVVICACILFSMGRQWLMYVRGVTVQSRITLACCLGHQSGGNFSVFLVRIRSLASRWRDRSPMLTTLSRSSSFFYS